MDGATIGLIGGIVGALLGVAGGAFGTYCSVHNTQSTAERAYMIRCAVSVWAFIVAFLVVLFVLPWAYWSLAWAVYAVLLVGMIVYMNRGQQRVREHDQRSA